MERKLLFLFLANALTCTVLVSGYSRTYRGGVVEYSPEVSGKEEDTVKKNVENYVEFIKEAKSKKVDIIVFPEWGLNTKTIASVIPDPVDRIVPCDDKNLKTTEAVVKLSCAAKENKVYTVVNMLEKRQFAPGEKNFYLFNTNVVFDRNGAVIARYSKYNLYELQTNRTERPEFSFFDTDFGVRFGTFTCFDILFGIPTLSLVQQYHITDFVFTTKWFSELPFLTALQVQKGWAESNNVNLLASGFSNPAGASGGSGIFNGKYGDLVNIFPTTNTRKLLVADIPRLDNSNSVSISENSFGGISGNFMSPPKTVVENKETYGLDLWKDHIHLFNSKVITTGAIFEQKVCSSENFCCEFSVDATPIKAEAKNYTYRAVALNGIRKFGTSFRGGVQVCGVILCNGPDLSNCTDRVEKASGLFHFKKVTITGDFSRRNSLQIPTTLHGGYAPVPFPAYMYEFKKTEKKNSVEASLELLWPTTNLHAFAIWGRDFSKDNAPIVPLSSGPRVTAPSLIATLIGFLLFGW